MTLNIFKIRNNEEPAHQNDQWANFGSLSQTSMHDFTPQKGIPIGIAIAAD